MRPTSKLFATFIFVFIIASCKKSAEEPQGNKECTLTVQHYSGNNDTEQDKEIISFDGQHRITSILNGVYDLTYSYGTDQVTVAANGTSEYKLNLQDGTVVRSQNLDNGYYSALTYNANRQLTKIESFRSDGNLLDTQLLTYKDGNLVKLVQSYTDSETTRTTTYAYSADPATRSLTDLMALYVYESANVPFSTPAPVSKNVLISSNYLWLSNNFRYETNTTYSFQKDSYGKVNRVIQEDHTVAISNGQQTLNEKTRRAFAFTTDCN